MYGSYIFQLLLSLLLTEIIELLISLFFLKRKEEMLIVFLVNVLTNPLVVYLCILTGKFLPGEIYYPLQIFLEILVVLSEGMIYKIFSGKVLDIRHPFVMSLVLNFISYATGIVISLGAYFLW